MLLILFGGSGRIRTHGAFRHISFQDCPIRPLWHTSVTGADNQNRTGHLFLTKEVLYRMSYISLVAMEGFEPPIFRV